MIGRNQSKSSTDREILYRNRIVRTPNAAGNKTAAVNKLNSALLPRQAPELEPEPPLPLPELPPSDPDVELEAGLVPLVLLLLPLLPPPALTAAIFVTVGYTYDASSSASFAR